MRGPFRIIRSLPALLALAAGMQNSSALAVPAYSAATPGIRTVLLVRHGEYDHDDPRDESVGKGLVPLGREQSQAVGRRLAGWPARVTVLRASTFTRARETAAIVGRVMHLTPQPEPGICECTPPTPRADVMKDLRPGEADSCVAQLEETVLKRFRPTADGDSVEAWICHGNVIRYLVCRALGVDPRAWLQMGIANCSVSEIQIRPDGTTRLMAFDDVGHLPGRLLTRGAAAMKPPPKAAARR